MKLFGYNPVRLGALLVAVYLAGIAQAGAADLDPNRFNRLMVPKSQRHPPLNKDGIHDPEAPGVAQLQAPKSAFEKLKKGKSGNYIDWVKSLNKGNINPMIDLKDKTVKPMPMDLNIVREVKGSMPDVVFPHRPHTVWLDCSNCHPDIFVPQKGANQMSMAEIILGKKCGVCHGKVAFPVAECRRCHSKQKSSKEIAKSKNKSRKKKK